MEGSFITRDISRKMCNLPYSIITSLGCWISRDGALRKCRFDHFVLTSGDLCRTVTEAVYYLCALHTAFWSYRQQPLDQRDGMQSPETLSAQHA